MQEFYKQTIEKLKKEGKSFPQIVEIIVLADRITQTLKNNGYDYKDMPRVIQLTQQKLAVMQSSITKENTEITC